MTKKLIVGLGNFPRQYNNTRHNIGFKVIDNLIERLNTTLSYEMFNGVFAKVFVEDNECFIAKPLTYMNLSGEFVSQLVKYLKIDISDIVIICDDINLDVGKIRIRKSGSSGGQNGLKNIIDKLATEDFKRIRLGVGKPTNARINLADYVLSKFDEKEKSVVDQVINKTSNIIIEYLQNNKIDDLMNNYNN